MPTPEKEEIAPPAPPTEEEILKGIQDEYELIAREMEGEALEADSLDYVCEDEMMDGRIMMFSSEGELRVIINSYAMGDHYGETEYWYFRNGEPFFALVEKGSWTFGGPGDIGEDGIPYPTTIDKISQERYYIAEEQVFRQLNKEYEIKSWEEGNPADEAVNQVVDTDGTLPQNFKWLQRVAENRVVDCATMPAAILELR